MFYPSNPVREGRREEKESIRAIIIADADEVRAVHRRARSPLDPKKKSLPSPNGLEPQWRVTHAP